MNITFSRSILQIFISDFEFSMNNMCVFKKSILLFYQSILTVIQSILNLIFTVKALLSLKLDSDVRQISKYLFI